MRDFLLVPLCVVAAAAACCGVCTAAGAPQQVRQIIPAAAITALAGAVATMPAYLARGAAQEAVMQAALASLGAHMLLTLALAAAAWALKAVVVAPALLGWLLGFYWLSLAALTFALVRMIRQARRQ